MHMMNEIDSRRWQQIRGQICLRLNYQKNLRTLDILATTYGWLAILPLPPFLPHTHIQRDIERCIFIAYIQQAMRISSSCKKWPATSQPSRWIITLPYIAQADKPIAGRFDIFQAGNMVTERDQNSFILLKKG